MLLHCTIFIHLLGTGLGVKKVLFEQGLPEQERVALLREFKMSAYPVAFFCMSSPSRQRSWAAPR